LTDKKKNYGGYFVTSHFLLSSRHKTKRRGENLLRSCSVVLYPRHNDKWYL